MSKKSPQLRFKGFTDDWEERKLGEIFNYEQPTKYIVKSTEYDDNFNTPVLTAGKSFLLGYTDEISGIKNATVENPVVIFDDFTTGSHYVDFPFKIKSSAMKLLSLNDNSDNFYFMFNTLKNIKYVPQSHERHWISKFSSFEIYKPSQEEQQKIGAFFKKIDDTIALHQRKLDLLKEQKKGFLQKMFPKNGAKVPELRFKGFADDWEERKLSEIGKIVTGNTPSTSNKGYYNGDFLFVSPADIQENRYVNKTTTTLTELGFKTGRLVPKGATLFVSIGSTIGKIGQSICDVITNQQINSVISFSDYDNDFIYTSILNSSTKIKQLAATQAVPIINKNEFGKSIIKIPSLEEQQKIGAFFKQLDDTIALHQLNLDFLKEQKKGFLQKMFV